LTAIINIIGCSEHVARDHVYYILFSLLCPSLNTYLRCLNYLLLQNLGAMEDLWPTVTIVSGFINQQAILITLS